MKKLSVIIPTLNEAENIGVLIKILQESVPTDCQNLLEIIVVDAKSADNTEGVARAAGARVIVSEKCSRAIQMNLGAAEATGEILYFVHADCVPPHSYFIDIQYFASQNYMLGCYRYRFNSPKFMLKINAYFTRFSPLWCRGGDETLFVTHEAFQILRGYDEKYCIMEEYDFLRRAWTSGLAFKIMPAYALVSARKYDTNSWLKVQLANGKAFRMFARGISPVQIKETYRQMLDYR